MDPQNTPLQKRGELYVANDASLNHYQRFKYPAWDARGKRRLAAAWLANVNKPIMYAPEASMAHDSFLYNDGGLLIERDSPISRGSRRESHRLINARGADKLTGLEKRRGLYNLWVQLDKKQGYPLNSMELRQKP